MQEELVNCLGGLSLPRKSVVRLLSRHDFSCEIFSADMKMPTNVGIFKLISIENFTLSKTEQENTCN